MRIAFLLCTLALLAACDGGGDAGAAGSGPPGGGRGGRPETPPVPVAVDRVFVGPIASYYRATASLEAEKLATVLARAEGVVERIVAEEGDRVQEGGALLHIRNDEYRLRLEQAEASTAQLRAAYERLEEMRKEQLATDAEYESARADLANAEAEEGLARLNLSYTTVTAPFTGVVTQRLIDPGENVSIGTEVFTLADVTPLLARVHVPSREFRQLQVDQQVQLRLDSTGTELDGRIKLVSPVIDPMSGTIKVTVEVQDYPEDTRPGDFAEVRIVTESRPEALLVPRTAVITEKGETVVFVVAGDGEQTMAERRLVELGFTDPDHAEILSGVSEGERVVTKGQRSLKHGQQVRVLEGPEA
jgi:membrane fusion protein (multidrug efflux system)